MVEEFEIELGGIDLRNLSTDEVFHIIYGTIERESDYGRLRERFFRWIIGRFGEYGVSALDLACGNGISTIALKDAGYITFGIDKSIDYILQARESVKVSDGVFLAAMDIENLGLAKDKFDLATLLGDPLSLFDIRTLKNIFSDICAILKPGGIIIANYRNWIDIALSGLLGKLGIELSLNYKSGEIRLNFPNRSAGFYLCAPFMIEYLLMCSGFGMVDTVVVKTDPIIIPPCITKAKKTK